MCHLFNLIYGLSLIYGHQMSLMYSENAEYFYNYLHNLQATIIISYKTAFLFFTLVVLLRNMYIYNTSFTFK